MENSEFKFEPIWISFLSLLPIYFIYRFIMIVTAPGFIMDSSIIWYAIFPLITGITLLPMAIKMIIGVPAILLNDNELVDNVVGISINWEDIEDIRISGISKPFLSITLKNKEKFFSDITNPIKRVLLKLIFLISPGDVSINLAMVTGSNESIVALSQLYWNRYYGHND
jgi:hypothetical protein